MERLYKVGDKVRCIAHTGSIELFWDEYKTPEIGEECEIIELLKMGGDFDGQLACIDGYSNIIGQNGENRTPIVAFNMRDFELIEQD